MSNTSNPIFNPSCPNGGQYYACGNGAKFVGCCASDPCNDSGCSFGNLRTMSFDPSYYGPAYLPDQQCILAGVQWWSCNTTNPPFVGCCSINPCSTSTGCPQSNLIQGTLSTIASSANKYDPQPPLSSSSSAASSAPTAPSDTSSSTSSSRISTGAVIGIAIGASALILFIVLLMWWWRRRSQYRRREQSALNPVLTPITAFRNEKNSNYQDIPSEPRYSKQGTPLPVYGFHSQSHLLKPQHQQIVHEADPAYQIQQSSGFSSPNTAHTFSPGISAIGSPSYYPQPPSELAGDSNSLSPQQQHTKGLGLQRMSTMVELGDSERGTDDSREREQRW